MISAQDVPASAVSPVAGSERSDTLDVLNYTIHLDFTQMQNDSIFGYCTVQLRSLINNVSAVSLDLLQMNVDSVTDGATQLSYAYNDTLLVITPGTPLNTGDTISVTVWYNGSPVTDASGWGGFYFQPPYAYNLGVGFQALPHVYGRVWFPCFDNFVERSTYTFEIISDNGNVSTANGYLVSEQPLNGTAIMRTWQMDEEIPTYLACVAVAPYADVQWTHTGIAGSYPVHLYALPSDTQNVHSSFLHLDDALDAFEQRFGPYRWNKVGYSMVPFSSGAMEHATNIAYPKVAANGSLAYETLYAHELSHHWWGDLVTCERPEEMWLNEGFATYCEALFLEHIYGYPAYLSEVADNHLYVLRYPHNLEGGYQTLSNIPQEYTYGDHVYKQGADILHNLRTYMGDSLFFSSLTNYLNDKQYIHHNSIVLRDSLESYSGLDLHPFFDNWVFNPGFPHFYIDSLLAVPSGNGWQATVYFQQKLTGAPVYFTGVPIQISIYDTAWNRFDTTVVLGGQYQTLSLDLALKPAYSTLNMNRKLNYAMTADEQVLTAPGTINMPNAMMQITVENVQDSAFVRVEHNWAAPDPLQDLSVKMALSTSRFWRVDGLIKGNTFDATARITYDGRTTSGNGGFLDNDLVAVTEDSLHLMYRRDPSEDWREFQWYHQDVLGNANNAFGIIFIDSLIFGEYTLANNQYDLGSKLPERDAPLRIYPNPGNGHFTIEYDLTGDGVLDLFSLDGKKIDSFQLPAGAGSYDFVISDTPGTVLYRVDVDGTSQGSGKLIVGS